MAEETIDMSNLPTKTVAEGIEVLQTCPPDMHVGVGEAVGEGDDMKVNIRPAVGFVRLTDPDNPDDLGTLGIFSYEGEVQS